MFRSPVARLAAGTLVLALPLGAAAGCGAEKKKTVKAELASAQSNLESSKAVAVTLRFDDSKGNMAKGLKGKGGDTPDALVQAVVKGSVTFVSDPAGDATFKSVKPSASAADLKSSLSKVNVAFVIRDDKDTLGEIRLVAGDLYAKVNVAEVGRLAKAGGATDFDSQLDDLGSQDPRLAQAIEDVRAGKWLKLPLTKYLDKLQDLAKSFDPALGGTSTTKKYDYNALGGRLFTAVKPYVTVTDANDSSTDRVLDVKVQARPAAKAVLAVLKAEGSLPFASALKAITPAEVDKNLSDGTARGQIKLSDGHLKQVSIDVESLRLLSTDPGTDTAAGVRVVLDVDDSADEVKAPTDLTSVDLGALLDEMLQGFSEGMQQG